MPRPLRIEFKNAWYHVMNRGANRQEIFKTNSHRNLFYIILGEIADQFKVEIHGFCLMNNHYHLLIKTPYANLGKTMRYLDGIYTKRFNKATHRDGPLFRGRYKAILIDSDRYLLQVSRYIHLNPIAAKLCKNPSEYEWSSYRAFETKNQSIAWLTTSFILNQMPGIDKRHSYLSFVEQGVDQELNNFYNKKHLPSILGTKKFIETHLKNLEVQYIEKVSPDINHTKPLPTNEMILNAVIEYFKISKNELYQSRQGKKNVPKMISIYLLAQLGQINHKTISEIFSSLKENSISTQNYRLKKIIAMNRKIKKYVIEITSKISQLDV